MCGLVGLILDYDPHADVDLSLLQSVVGDLTAVPGDLETAQCALEKVLHRLSTLSYDLVQWPGFRRLRRDPDARRAVANLAQILEGFARETDACLQDPERLRALSSSDVERRSQLAISARDVAWRLERDALANVEAVAALAPTDETRDKVWFELWRAHVILNQLGRLEVRGRDSGGLGVVVALPPKTWTEVQAELGRAGLAEDLGRRLAIPYFQDGAILQATRPDGTQVLALGLKVAREVGELGANVRELRAKLSADALLRALVAPEAAQVQLLAHTRWASNGAINEPNCHPIGNDVAGDPPQRLVLAALNGDVDNFPGLATKFAIPSACTTDAKVIPLEVELRLGAQDTPDLTEACRDAAAHFDGSTAIGVVASDDPSCVHLTQRGSGQAVYVGELPGGGWLFASELYGVVELASRFYKLDGQRGELVRLDAQGIQRIDLAGGERPLEPNAFKHAEIATRDIDRADFPHYLLKEISEAPRSVERTLRGKFLLDPQTQAAQFLLGSDVIPEAVRARFADKTLERIYVIGQGTAAVAGQAFSEAMHALLLPAGIAVQALPATELSGFALEHLGPSTLIVAVSQSGTTTDTNRTVDLARERGAPVVAIVNRRGSDLADKADGVLYTSDGRDVEMSVASTKAFYCQVVAGFLLGLQFAELADAITPEALSQRLVYLQDLPRCLREVLTDARDRVRAAAKRALRRRHWTVVGSGPGLQAAREIRIKLSELCYKSVPVDTIEDKKHIDLSSEPMILVCAAGLTGAAVSDAVKEVAIFKAHAAIPVVICNRGESRFAEYADALIEVPTSSPEVALLLNTIAGHLFSYEVALAIDDQTAPLKQARDACLEAVAALKRLQPALPADVAGVRQRLRTALDQPAHEALRRAHQGLWDAGLSGLEVLQTAEALRAGLGELPTSALQQGGELPSFLDVCEWVGASLTHAVDALRRPIDAIKHQAKTVTVGISRAETALEAEGLLFEALVALGVGPEDMAEPDLAALSALTPVIASVAGSVRYRLEGLGPLGSPTRRAQVVVERKTGIAEGLSSRADQGAPLQGTKRLVARSPRVWVGAGRRDQRSLAICPVYKEGVLAGLGLLHVEFARDVGLRERIRALRAVGRYEDLRCLVTELDVEWSNDLLSEFDVADLLTVPVEVLGARITERTPQPDRPAAEVAESKESRS